MKKIFRQIIKKKPLLAVIGIAIIGGLWWKSNQSTEKPTTQVNPAYRDIVEILNVSGRIDAEQKARLTFAGASKLTWLPVKEGDFVKKWQGLAKVDSRTLENQLQIAQNTHGKTFRSFESTLDSVEYYSQSGLNDTERRTAENAQLDIKSSALAVESANIAITQAVMSSPFDGIITRIDQKNVGALMLPTDSIEVVNPKSIFFNAVVDEEDISKINASQTATIQLDAFDQQTISSHIKRIGFTPSVSESGGTGYQLWLELPVNNESLTYRLGMNGEASIILNQKNQVLSIPTDAVIERDGKQFVDTLSDGKTVRKEVTLGISDDDYIEVLSGLSESDLVIIPTS